MFSNVRIFELFRTRLFEYSSFFRTSHFRMFEYSNKYSNFSRSGQSSSEHSVLKPVHSFNQRSTLQVLALQWVNSEISNFGGDPNRVTLCGQGDGGCAVSAHTLSPISQSTSKYIIDRVDEADIMALYSSFPTSYYSKRTVARLLFFRPVH